MIIVTISYYGPPDFELQLGSGDLGPRLIFRATAAAPSRAARDATRERCGPLAQRHARDR